MSLAREWLLRLVYTRVYGWCWFLKRLRCQRAWWSWGRETARTPWTRPACRSRCLPSRWAFLSFSTGKVVRRPFVHFVFSIFGILVSLRPYYIFRFKVDLFPYLDRISSVLRYNENPSIIRIFGPIDLVLTRSVSSLFHSCPSVGWSVGRMVDKSVMIS